MQHNALHTIDGIDILALAFFIGAWIAYAYVSQRISSSRSTLFSVVNSYRLKWMKQMLKREIRIADMTAVSNLLKSISFFANTSIFIVLGVITMFGYKSEALAVISTIPYSSTPSDLLWEIKLFLIILIFVYAFFKFTWSLRQYNYTSIFISAAPQPDEHVEHHESIAQAGAGLMTSAGRHFNLGIRAYYYGLAAFTWFIHPLLFLVVTAIVVAVLYRREFHSNAYASLAIYEDFKKEHNNA